MCDFLTDKTKVYEAVLLLGRETDTQDTSGTTIAEKAVTATLPEIEKAIRSFIGEYAQVPPMYSAIKQDGKKLYELARAGKTVERKARQVFIHDIEILSVTIPTVHLRVTCSKGTYIRTLCHDVGTVLGCGGCMAELVRTKTGGFSIEDSVTLARLEDIRDRDGLAEIVLPVDKVLAEYQQTMVTAEGERFLYNGNALPASHLVKGEELIAEEGIRVYDLSGQFIALYKYDVDKQKFKPLKMFYGGS